MQFLRNSLTQVAISVALVAVLFGSSEAQDCSHLPLSERWMCSSAGIGDISITSDPDCDSLPLSEKWRCATPNGGSAGSGGFNSNVDCSTLPSDERWKCASPAGGVSITTDAVMGGLDCSNLPPSEKWRCAQPFDVAPEVGSMTPSRDCTGLSLPELWMCTASALQTFDAGMVAQQNHLTANSDYKSYTKQGNENNRGKVKQALSSQSNRNLVKNTDSNPQQGGASDKVEKYIYYTMSSSGELLPPLPPSEETPSPSTSSPVSTTAKAKTKAPTTSTKSVATRSKVSSALSSPKNSVQSPPPSNSKNTSQPLEGKPSDKVERYLYYTVASNGKLVLPLPPEQTSTNNNNNPKASNSNSAPTRPNGTISPLTIVSQNATDDSNSITPVGASSNVNSTSVTTPIPIDSDRKFCLDAGPNSVLVRLYCSWFP